MKYYRLAVAGIVRLITLLLNAATYWRAERGLSERDNEPRKRPVA